jgi:radical SAM superfamily enzyme YgiQ (UPF0313 family)
MRPPLEECEAAGAVSALGAKHWIIDAPAEGITEPEFLSAVLAHEPDLVVVAVTFGSLEADLKWAVRIRELLPVARIALRGAPCYVSPEKILERCPAVDFCLRGDYELVFEELLLKAPQDARGVVSRGGDGVVVQNPPCHAPNLDDLPLPDRSQIKSQLYRVRGTRRQQATVHVQRGCPFPCTFCLVHTVSGNRPRHRSPQSIAAEVRGLMEQGITRFYLRAETFTVDRSWALQVSRTLKQECPGARWVTATRVECVDEELLQAMWQGGCYGISFGVDVASEQVGAAVKKRPALKAAEEAMRLCDRIGIVTLAYFMVGFIWETKASLEETAGFARTIAPDLVTIHYAFPYPGTVYHQQAEELGLVALSTKAQAEPALSVTGVTDRELRRFSKRLLVRHYLRPRVWLSLLLKGARNSLRTLSEAFPVSREDPSESRIL